LLRLTSTAINDSGGTRHWNLVLATFYTQRTYRVLETLPELTLGLIVALTNMNCHRMRNSRSQIVTMTIIFAGTIADAPYSPRADR